MTTLIKITTILLIFIPAAILAESKCKSKSGESQIAKIKNKILCNYDKEYRPIKDQKKAINVTIAMIVKSVDLITHQNNKFRVDSWIKMRWTDEFLKWNSADYNKIDTIHINTDDIWKPDFKQDMTDTPILESTDCILRSTGQVTCLATGSHDSQCDINVDNWPYDTQQCNLIFGSFVNDITKVYFKIESDPVTTGKESPEWKLIRTKAQVATEEEYNKEIHQIITFAFVSERHSRRTSATIFIPAISLVVMTLVPLWMEVGRPERLCLLTSNILSHFLFIMHLSWYAPKGGDTVPKAVSFFRDSLAMSMVVLIEFTLVKTLISNKTISPTWLLTPCKVLSNGVFGRGLLIEEIQDGKEDGKEDENEIQVQDENQIKNRKTHQETLLIVTVIDRLFFFGLLLFYIITVFSKIPIKI